MFGKGNEKGASMARIAFNLPYFFANSRLLSTEAIGAYFLVAALSHMDGEALHEDDPRISPIVRFHFNQLTQRGLLIEENLTFRVRV